MIYMLKKVTKFFSSLWRCNRSLNIINLVEKIRPDEIYNLAAQSHVKVSFETPEYTANADALGPLRILEAIKNPKKIKKIKYYQASTSEMFGNIKPPQSEKSRFEPESPYGTAKVFGYWITKIIGMHMVFLHQMEFYLIMKVSIGVRLLLLKKLQVA